MFNTMTMTKIVGGAGSALLIFLLGSWVADTLYATEGGHGEGHEQAYVIEVEGAESESDATAEAEAEPDFAVILASADVAKGEKVYGKCKACHKTEEGAHATGPSLFGIVGRDVAAADGFGYSSTMAEMGGQWTPERINEFLIKPKDMVPGTKMSFAGLKKISDRANLIAYLATIGG